MADKQQEQSSVKSGDVLLLYEDGHGGYVYSDITPRLPEYSCVCFYPVKSRQDPGLPDVNCATFSVQLVNEKKSASGAPIHYGQSIKLRHTATGRFLAVSKTATARCEPNLRVELLAIADSGDTTDDGCHFRIVPLHSDHALGNQVCFNQPVKFESIGVPGHFLHCSSEPHRDSLWVVPDRHELNVSSSASTLLMILHRSISSTETLGCHAGKLLKLSETQESFSIIAKGFRFRNPLAFSRNPMLDIPDITADCRKSPWDPRDVCAQNRYTDPGKTWFPASLWQFEEEKNPTSGEVIKFNNHYRIKHLLTQKYLALVTRCRHDLNVCPKTLCREAFKVVLKDRSWIGKSEQEDTYYDDTVFTPVSPDEQTSTLPVTEGTQILLRHKKTGMWLNVFHDTVFQWHDIPKRKDHFTQYNLQPFYEADADQRLLAVAKNPHHAFSVQECFMNPAVLYEVSGILPILIMYIKEFQTQKQSGKQLVGVFGPKPLKLEPLKQLLTPESMAQYHAFVAQLGVIELLLALKGSQLDVTFDLLERFLSQASSYEKNRFNAVLATVTEAYKKLGTCSGMEVKATLMFNNMSAWEDAETSVKGFLKHVKTESKVVLDILGRMCISGGKPVGVIQDAIVNRLQVDSHFREMLYKMEVEGNRVVVYRENAKDSKKLLSSLKNQELHSLHYQLILFSRLLQGGSRLAQQVIVKRRPEDDGFISFEEAIKCTKNEDRTLSPLLHGAFIQLMRVLCAESLEGQFNVLEPPTWCFEEKETGLTGALCLRESGSVNQLMRWIKDFKAFGGHVDGSVLLEVMKLLDVLLKKGYCTEMEVVEASFTKVLEILQVTSDLDDHVNYDVIFGLIPLFFHLQMRLKVQGSFQKRNTHQNMNLQQTTLDAMKVLVDGESQVPHVLVICYFCWMNLHRGLHKGAEGTAHEVQRLITDESRSVLQGALQNYPWLRQCLKSFATTDQSKKVKEVLKEFAGHCILKGVPHRRHQLIYSCIILDDILSYIFDPSTSFPMWCWCRICKQGPSNIASSPSVEECFRFLQALTYNNLRVQTRLVQHLDDILPYCEVYPKEVAQLLIEIFGGEAVTEQSDVFHIIENIHLKINEGQIKLLLQIATRRLKVKMPGLPLLKALPFISTYDEADLPITRNQDYMMKNLAVDKSILARASKSLVEEPQGFVTSVLRTNEEYLLGLTNLLAACAEGKSLSIDAQCQSIHQPLELLHILCKPHIPPMKKTPFLRFLISVYMDCKGSVRLDIFNPVIWQQIWQYLQTVATFLLEVGNDLQQRLQQSSTEDVQEILIDILRPYGIPNSAIEDVDGAADFAGALYYLVKGVLPMLIEFYGPVFQQSPSEYLNHDHIKVTQDICSSLLALEEGARKVFVSPIHLKMYHVSVAAVVAALPREHLPPSVNLEEVLGKGDTELASITSAVKKKYDSEHRLEDQESERFKESLKEVLEWNEHDAFQKLLDIFQSEKSSSGAQKCTEVLASVLLWLYNEAPLQDWPIYPAVHGLASRCIKALELHVEDLKRKDEVLPDRSKKGLHFDKFCEQFSRGEHNHLEEVLRIAAVSNMEKLANETLSFLEMLLDSHDNPVRRLLAESIESTETHFPPLGNFLHAVHSCVRDSITASKARIDLREEIEEREGIGTSESAECLLDEVAKCTDGIPPIRFSRPSFSSRTSQFSQTTGQGSLVKYRIEELIPSMQKLKKMLSIVGLMCDEQNRTLQSHLRKQPGRFDSVNIVGDVVELLHHMHAMHVNALTSQSTRFTKVAMDIIGLILQALIEFCAGNYENQEVVVNRQISGDITWILTADEADEECELHILKAQAVELLETLMEEVAVGSKGLVEKLRADEKLRVSLNFATEEFHQHIKAVHATQVPGWRERSGSLPRRAADPDPSNREERSNLCKPKAKHARFRAYHLASSLKRKTSAVEDIAREGRASSDEPENQEGKHFCEEHSKSIEVSYKHEKRGEPIHTAVSFPYHPHDELREEMKEKIKWSIDRSSPEDKLLDLVRHTEAVTKDIEHQKRLRAGLLQIIRLSSTTRHYVLLMLTFFLNLVVLLTFAVPPEKNPLKDAESSFSFPNEADSAVVHPQPPLSLSDLVLNVFGVIHLVLSLWMVMEYYAVTWPHFFIRGWPWWAMLLPRSIWRIVFEIWKSTHQRWKKHEHRKYFEPPNEQKLEASLYGWDSIYRLVFLCSSVISLLPTLQGYVYCLCLLYLVEESDVLSRVLQAVTKNGKSLLWVGALGMVVLYIYAVISFAFIHESFFVENPSYPLFCENLGQCFVSVIRYGLLDNIGLIIPLVSGDFSEASWRLLYDVSFFIIVTTIGLNIIFGIIVDTFSELRDLRWNNEQDMNDRCHICGIDNYEFDRLQQNGFKHHVAHDHNMWNYIYYYVYVSRVPVRDRTAIQTYVFQAIESGRINFFPRKCALVLTDRETEATTDDLMKRVKMATHGLALDIAHQARGTREVVVMKFNKKLAQSTQIDSTKKEDTSGELEMKFERMMDEFEIMKGGVKEQIRSVQSDLSQVQQTLAKIATLSSTILQRLPDKVNYSTVMSYGLPAKIQNLQEEVSGCSAQIQELSAKVREHDEELSEMKREMELLLSELGQS